jgi:hypothetical protein
MDIQTVLDIHGQGPRRVPSFDYCLEDAECFHTYVLLSPAAVVAAVHPAHRHRPMGALYFPVAYEDAR